MPAEQATALRSEGLRDFISYRPGVLVRWGIPLFFLVLLVLAAVSYFIRYPDIIQARARIVSVNPPKPVIAKTGGRLTRILIADNATVNAGDIIAYMESNADPAEVIRLAAVLDTLAYFADSNHLEEIPVFWQRTPQAFGHLGELQGNHQSFMQQYTSFKDYISTGYYIAKKRMLMRDLANAKRLLQTILEQKKLQEEDLALTIENYNVHDTLHREALINDLEYRGQQSQLIGKKMTIPQVRAAIISNEGQQNALVKEMMELDNSILQQKAAFVQALHTYQSQVQEWMQQYLLQAPISGTLVFAGFPEENQLLTTGQLLGYITRSADRYFVEMMIPQTGFGKVHTGQEVQLSFPGFPSREFGTVKGTIDQIKSIPTDSGYLAKVILPKGLATSYNKQINFVEGLVADASIITDQRRLSQRFMQGFRDLVK